MKLNIVTGTIILGLAFSAACANAEHFLVTYSPGEQWSDNVIRRGKLVKKHQRYMMDLGKKNIVLMSGSLSANESLAVLHGDSLSTVEKLIKKDPAVKKGVLAIQIETWSLELSVLKPTQAHPSVAVPTSPYKLDRIGSSRTAYTNK